MHRQLVILSLRHISSNNSEWHYNSDLEGDFHSTAAVNGEIVTAFMETEISVTAWMIDIFDVRDLLIVIGDKGDVLFEERND